MKKLGCERERERRGFTIFKMHEVMCVDGNTTNMEREREREREQK